MRSYSNIAVQTTLAGAIDADDTALTVTDATGYPAPPFAIVLDPGSATSEEVCLVTAAAGAGFTVTRGYDGTTGKPHSGGATVIHAVIAADLADAQTHIAATTGVHGIADTADLVLTDDARLSDARAPTGAAGGVLSGTYPDPGFAADMATQAELDAHIADTANPHAVTAAQAGAYSTAETDALLASYLLSADYGWSTLTGTPTTLAGYGITDAQPLDAELSALAGLTSAADTAPYFTGSGTAALAGLTAAGRALIDDADTTAQRATLGLGTAAQSASTDFVSATATQTIHTVLAGPAGGSAAAPTFRALAQSDLPAMGSILLPASVSLLDISAVTADLDTDVRIGAQNTGNHAAEVDLVGDATYPAYGLRLQRGNAGANAVSKLTHRGTGDLELRTEDAGALTVYTNNTLRMTIASDGTITLAAPLAPGSGGTGVANSETLAYSSGTYTPTYVGSASAGTTTYGVQTGKWQRVGALEFVQGQVTWTNATGTGTAQISLPSTPAAFGTGAVRLSGVTFANSAPEVLVSNAGAFFTLDSPLTNAAPGAVTVEAAGNILFAVWYFVA